MNIDVKISQRVFDTKKQKTRCVIKCVFNIRPYNGLSKYEYSKTSI